MSFEHVSMSPPKATARKNYVTALLRLREAIDRNKQDTEFAANMKNRTFYIFDTNVFVSFAALKDKRRLTRDIDALLGQPSARSGQMAIERLTADYLFSGHLPGQRDPTCYVSNQHFEEILGQCKAIAARLASGLKLHSRRVSRAEDRVNRIRDVLESRGSTRKKLEQLSFVVPRAWLETLDETAHFIDSTHKAFLSEAPIIVPLEQEAWGEAASRLRPQDISRWRKLLPPQKRSAGAVEEDAETLATIVNLYRRNLDSRFPERRLLFLFVTSDTGIVQAVEKEANALASEGIPYSFERHTTTFLS